jgi:hypothetical protein
LNFDSCARIKKEQTVMSTSKWTLRPSLMRRSIQGARAAGIEIAQINVAPDGSISIVPERAEDKPAADDTVKDLDRWLDKRVEWNARTA